MYDEQLAERVRAAVDGHAVEAPRTMFGGKAFLVDGNMAVCAGHDGGLLVRTTDVSTHVREDGSGPLTAMVMKDKPSRTWLRVAPEAVADEESLRKWVAIGLAVAASLPPKQHDDEGLEAQEA